MPAWRRCEHDRLTIRGPALSEIAARLPRQPPRLATVSGDNIDIQVPRVLAAESNPFPVRGELRVGRLSVETRHPPRTPTRTRHSPNIVGVSERDLRRANGRRAQESSLPRRLRLGRELSGNETHG